ncbi:hypothetical protein PCANC_02686 [Puccinia coronata f. sp. avenae]|uniref:Uncharacterized protein n=1 Tax=Puccinia coronata f. sp. avenae TaxID=200324 RepID=A0A2N5VYC5_9BASI|nr:hypothetical protein PCANC_02686 [Puccinia coronata f. sp. avenae]
MNFVISTSAVIDVSHPQVPATGTRVPFALAAAGVGTGARAQDPLFFEEVPAPVASTWVQGAISSAKIMGHNLHTVLIINKETHIIGVIFINCVNLLLSINISFFIFL